MPLCLLPKAVLWDDGHLAHFPPHCTSNILHDLLSLLKALGIPTSSMLHCRRHPVLCS